MTVLNRTAPFLACCTDGPGTGVLLDDRFFPGSAAISTLRHKVARSLRLRDIADVFSMEEAAVLIEEQYVCAIRFIFMHPVWEDFRLGRNREALISYLVETRHYLHAATWRMAPGSASSFTEFGAALHLARHVVEEAGHARTRQDRPILGARCGGGLSHDVARVALAFGRTCLPRAALVPCLAWSFLDGVLAYYGRRGGIPVCRIGWTAD